MYDAAYAVGQASPIATSQYFNISSPPSTSSPSSSSLSSSTSSRTGTATRIDHGGSTSTSTSGAPSASPTPQSDSNDSLAIGLGVGLGCAFVLALLTAGFFYRRYRKRQAWDFAPGRTQDPRAGREPYSAEYSPHTHETAAKYSGPSGPQPPYQLHSDFVPPAQPQEKWSHNIEPSRSELQ